MLTVKDFIQCISNIITDTLYKIFVSHLNLIIIPHYT